MAGEKRGPKAELAPLSPEAERVGTAIRRLRESKKWGAPALAKLVKISQPMLSKYENGHFNPQNRKSWETLRRIGKIFRNNLGLKDLDIGNEIPIEGQVAGGRPIERIETGETISVDRDLIKTAGGATVLRVSGDSMIADHILHGDLLVCRKTANPPKGSIVVVEFKGERGASVKRIEIRSDKIFLYSERHTPDEEKMSFYKWEVGKIFEITGLIRKVQ